MNETAASLGIDLAILQASEFHNGLSGTWGKASCKIKAAVKTLTGVWQNGYRSYGLGRIIQLHLSLNIPNEYILELDGGAFKCRVAKNVISPFGS